MGDTTGSYEDHARTAVADRLELAAAPEPRALPDHGVDPASVRGLAVRAGLTVEDVLHRHDARSLVVVHRGALAYEWYASGTGPTRRHACFSVTKSFTGTLAALAVHEGALDRSAMVGTLVPDLAGSAFADATVGQVADMTVSVNYSEDYTDETRGAGDGGPYGFGDYLAAVLGEGPWTVRQLVARFGPGPHPHGEVFDYATPKTDVLGWVLETVRDRGYADLLDAGIWRWVGAERPARLGVTPDGMPVLGAGLAVTTRDLARAGLVVAEGRHVPTAVVASMRAGDPGPLARGGHYAYLDDYAYRDQWWLPPAAGGGAGPRPLSAWGIHGQLLWIDPEAELVVACHSAGAPPSDEARDLDHDALCRALTEASRGW